MKKSMNDLFGKFSIEKDNLTSVQGGAASRGSATGDTCSDHGEGCYADDCDVSPVPIIVLKRG